MKGSVKTASICFNYVTTSIYTAIFSSNVIYFTASDRYEDEATVAFKTGRLIIAKGSKSNVWQHFKVLDSGLFSDKAQCNHCKVLVARGSSNSPSNLSTHLKRHHKEIYDAGLLSSLMKDGPMDLFVNQGCEGHFKDAFCRWLVHDMQPLSVGKSSEFKAMLASTGCKVNIPERQAVSKRLGEIEIQIRYQLAFILTKEHVSVTTNACTSIANIAYCSLTVSFINSKWQLIVANLDCLPFAGLHT